MGSRQGELPKREVELRWALPHTIPVLPAGTILPLPLVHQSGSPPQPVRVTREGAWSARTEQVGENPGVSALF